MTSTAATSTPRTAIDNVHNIADHIMLMYPEISEAELMPPLRELCLQIDREAVVTPDSEAFISANIDKRVSAVVARLHRDVSPATLIALCRDHGHNPEVLRLCAQFCQQHKQLQHNLENSHGMDDASLIENTDIEEAFGRTRAELTAMAKRIYGK